MTSKKINNIITPKKDIVFKRLFGSVGSETILKDLLEAILEIKIESVDLGLNKEIIPRNIRGKRNVLDVRANLKDGTQINIEMQLAIPKNLEKRNLDYWSNLYTSQLDEGMAYKFLNKTIAIWILDEDFFKDIAYYHTKWIIKEAKCNMEGYFTDFELHFLELNKLRKSDIVKPKKLDFWMWFIDHTNEEMIKMAYENEEQVREALDKLRELSSNRALVDLMFRERLYEMDQQEMKEQLEEEATKRGLEKGMKQGMKQGLEKGIKQGIEQGKQEGLEKEKEETVKRMLKANIAIEIIMQATELSKEEIEKIKSEIDYQ